MNILWLGSRHGLNNFEQIAIVFVLVAAFISLAYAWWLRGTVLKKDKGTEKMQEIWNAIRIGANSYLEPPTQDHSAADWRSDSGYVLERLRCSTKRGSHAGIQVLSAHRALR